MANSSQQGLEEVLGLEVKVVSISGAKGKKIIEAQKWKSQAYRQARAERSAIDSLVPSGMLRPPRSARYPRRRPQPPSHLG
jgi:hypothetical protein